MTRRRARSMRPQSQSGRRKLLALLAGGAVTALVLLVGLVLAIGYALGPTGHTSPGHNQRQRHEPSAAATSRAEARPGTDDPRDVLAARPMPSVDDAAAHPGAMSTRDPGTPIVIPLPTMTGPAGVPTGFPQTPAGALAQLAAIDQTVLQSESPSTAWDVVAAWVLPGGPTVESWSTAQGLVGLLSAAQSGATAQLAVVLTPLMGQIKGSVGADFVIPCVDFELDVTLAQTARGAVADCQRMSWQPDPDVTGGRWLIAPGAEPAPAPAVWPGTDASFAVGYRWLHREAGGE